MTLPPTPLFGGAEPVPEFYAFYAANLRSGLFSGFLTLGGFLLAMKTLVVIQLRKELYDTKHYRKRVIKCRELDKSLKVYGPLRMFGRLLLLAVCLALTTAFSQFTVGLYPATWAAGFCVGLALVTVVALVAALWVLWNNLGDLFLFWEEEAEQKIVDENAAPIAPR